ncbi:MAG: ABC transporter permease [Candidatus Eisenbacteria bacterium]
MAVTTFVARLRTAAWLGWQVESNWADPVLFFVYMIARPLAVALTLAAMYWATQGRASAGAAFAGFYVANALHAYVNTIAVGMGWAMFEEREEFETLKYVYISPMGLFTYLAGRAVVRFVLGTLSAAFLLLVGWFALGVRWDWAHVQWLPLAASQVLGLAAALAGGFLLSGLAMVLMRASMTVLDGAWLTMFLLSGVLFPPELLPLWLRPLAFLLPFTWWYEAVRRFLLDTTSSTTLAALSGAQLLAGQALVTLVFAGVAWRTFRAMEDRARRLGRLDQTTMF